MRRLGAMIMSVLLVAAFDAAAQSDPAKPPATESGAPCEGCDRPRGPKEVRIDNRTTAGSARGAKENVGAAGFPPATITPVELAERGARVVDFEDGTPGCYFSIDITFDDGRRFRRRMNICGLDAIVITDADLEPSSPDKP